MRVIVEEKDGILAGLSDTDRDLWHEVIYTYRKWEPGFIGIFKFIWPYTNLLSSLTHPSSSILTFLYVVIK